MMKFICCAGRMKYALSTPPANFRVVAIMSSLNEADIIGPFCGPASTVEGHGHHRDMSVVAHDVG